MGRGRGREGAWGVGSRWVKAVEVRGKLFLAGESNRLVEDGNSMEMGFLLFPIKVTRVELQQDLAPGEQTGAKNTPLKWPDPDIKGLAAVELSRVEEDKARLFHVEW